MFLEYVSSNQGNYQCGLLGIMCFEQPPKLYRPLFSCPFSPSKAASLCFVEIVVDCVLAKLRDNLLPLITKDPLNAYCSNHKDSLKYNGSSKLFEKCQLV